MDIAVIGLGLIGGSLCKTIKKLTDNTVWGFDIDEKTVESAVNLGAIDGVCLEDTLNHADMVFVCLHPDATIKYILDNINRFKKGSIVADVCGVKQYIVNAVEDKLHEKGVHFVGTHPMAGRQFSGFEYTTDTLFDNASFIITKTKLTDSSAIKTIEDFATKLKFGKVVVATTAEHDKNIAFTSQLAHVVSNAYIKSPTALLEDGFSAGSFLDLTRVAKLNASMWTELFMANSENLSAEIGMLISHLTEYKKAIDQADYDTLRELLKKGSEIKEKTLEN